MLSLEGRQLGNYDVMRRIRSGGMGAVYEGRQRTAFGRRVAIKVILGDYAEDRDMRRRFAREAKTIARLHHPHILPLIEFGDEQGVLYLVMPFIEGGTLSSYLRRHLPDLHEVSAIFQQILDAVEYAHEEGLIHRDIKSSNVLLEMRRNGPPYAYLADFGLVRTIQQDTLQQTGVTLPLDQVPGTPHYMAPEQTRGIATPATDIYALGVLLYQMLTGELPYDDPDDIAVIKMHLHAPVPNPCDMDASIPSELGAVVTHAMAKRAEQRFPDVSAFREAVHAAFDGLEARPERETFEDEVEEVYDVPPRPQATPRAPVPPLRMPSQPLRHPSEQLRGAGQAPRPIPAPIEFREADIPPVARRPRITDDYAEASPTTERRGRITEDRPVSKPRQRAVIEPLAPKKTAALPRQRDAMEPLVPKKTVPMEPFDHNAPTVQDMSAVPTQRTIPLRSRPARHARPTVAPTPPERAMPAAYPRRKRSPVALLVGLALPIVLIALLLVTHVLGLNIWPFGFPAFGTAPVATITLTVQTKQLNDTFLLTASPQTPQANLATHVVPDRSLASTVSASQSVATSGQQTTPATQASGILHFSNSSLLPVSVPGGSIFTTSTGVQIRLVRGNLVVPANLGGKSGMIDAPGVAVVAGQGGNLAPNALDVPCCGSPMVTVSNPAAFSGGSDARVTHLVAQGDLDGVRDTLLVGLQRQALQQVDGLLAPNEVRAGSPVYSNNITANPPVGSVATRVTVNVSLSVSVLAYDTHLVSDLARQLLSNEATQTLGASYQVRGGLNIAPPLVEQQGSAGQLYLSVAASGLWAYKVTASMEQTWRQAIKGASLPLAQSYLSTRPGISAAHIALPFGSDHVPTDERQVVFVIG